MNCLWMSHFFFSEYDKEFNFIVAFNTSKCYFQLVWLFFQLKWWARRKKTTRTSKQVNLILRNTEQIRHKLIPPDVNYFLKSKFNLINWQCDSGSSIKKKLVGFLRCQCYNHQQFSDNNVLACFSSELQNKTNPNQLWCCGYTVASSVDCYFASVAVTFVGGLSLSLSVYLLTHNTVSVCFTIFLRSNSVNVQTYWLLDWIVWLLNI